MLSKLNEVALKNPGEEKGDGVGNINMVVALLVSEGYQHMFGECCTPQCVTSHKDYEHM